MSQPVKLSDTLVLEARLSGKAMERSIAGQVEYWARLGKAVEGLLTGRQVAALSSETVLARLEDVDTPAGRQRVQDDLANGPYPRFTAHPDGRQLLVREDADGRKTVGRFVNREFVAVKGGSRAERFSDFTEEEFKAMRLSAEESLFRIRFQKSLGDLEGIKKIRPLKLDLARAKSIARELQLDTEKAANSAVGRTAPRARTHTARKKANA